jgi:predicted amidophosphoribosyltransferase
VSLLDLIFPPRCGGCGLYGAAWCATCAAGLRPPPASALAGIPLVAAGRLEGPLQQAIHTYKYRPRPQLASVLAQSWRPIYRCRPSASCHCIRDAAASAASTRRSDWLLSSPARWAFPCWAG